MDVIDKYKSKHFAGAAKVTVFWDSPVIIGDKQVKNRIVFPPVSGNWADPNGFITQKILDFYTTVAEGGCGMVVVAGTAISSEAKGTDHAPILCEEKHLAGFSSLAERIRKKDCFASLQLMHVGGQGNPDFTSFYPVSPSGVKCETTGITPKILTTDQIKDIRDKFIASALLARRAGFNAVELHLAHGYLLHEFLSEYHNRRTDEYGGSFENRLHLVMDIIAGIREKIPDMIIGARISGEDYIDKGINEKVNRRLLPLLEQASVKYFSVTAGIYDTSKFKHEAMKRGDFFIYSRNIKLIVKSVVIGVGKILDLDSAEKHIKNNNCDMVAMGRALIADPMMIYKQKNNQKINRCIECDQCMYLRQGEKYMVCPVSRI
jgi:2,4-dienoyl-CoA reductase-like NADH-dependent reductase (Old Yellow Enzyme family)